MNVITKSATNDLHGQLFGNFRDKAAGGAGLSGGQDNSYSREVFGGNVGGAWKKDKLFYFLSGEYFKQDLDAPVVFNAPFDVLDGSYNAPFHETEAAARLDYKLSSQSQLFYRFTYDNGSDVNSFGGNNFPAASRVATIHSGTPSDLTSPADRMFTAFASPTTATPTTLTDAVGGTQHFRSRPGTQSEFHGRLRIRQRAQSAGAAADQAGQHTGPLRRHQSLGKPYPALRRGGEQD